MRITVTGIEQTIAKLAELGAATSGPAVAEAAQAGAVPVMEVAKARAPVATGRLRDSIHIETDVTGPTEAEARVTTDVEYARFVEYGTADAPAQPFLRPAADSAGAEAEALVGASLLARIRAVVGL